MPLQDAAGEEIEFVGVDHNGRIVEGAHGNELAEILIEPILESGGIVSGDVVELRLGKAFLLGRNGKPRRYGYGETKARGRKDRPEAPTGCHFLLTSDRSDMRRLASLVQHLRLGRRQRRRTPGEGAEAFRPLLQMP